jgi:hypothetical protein
MIIIVAKQYFYQKQFFLIRPINYVWSAPIVAFIEC